ncbi:hypothetical protein HanRHA438_Chr13g0624101 [Helianthus annuus]|nr:hypothetical protein HanRHA438_Chr13g0624101 [Helianthus annuus]
METMTPGVCKPTGEVTLRRQDRPADKVHLCEESCVLCTEVRHSVYGLGVH